MEILVVELLYVLIIVATLNDASPILAETSNKEKGYTEVIEGDIVLDRRLKELIENNGKREIITSDGSHRWPKSQHANVVKIPYIFEGIGSVQKTSLDEAIQVFKRLTCVDFIPRNGESDYVAFIRGKGCQSMIGRQGGRQEVSLGNQCYSVGTVLHEMMHALGFFHEQSRPDRDKYVEILPGNMKEGSEFNFKIYNFMNTAGKPYDLHSLMHYRRKDFSKNGENTIQAKEDPTMELGNKFLSKVDVLQTNELLGCPKKYWDVTDYSITVYTSNVWWAGTDAKVFMELKSGDGMSTGEFQVKGDFEAGDKDIYDVMATHLQKVSTLSVRHDDSGFNAAWKLDKIVVKDRKDGKTYTFPCDCWLEDYPNTIFLNAS